MCGEGGGGGGRVRMNGNGSFDGSGFEVVASARSACPVAMDDQVCMRFVVLA